MVQVRLEVLVAAAVLIMRAMAVVAAAILLLVVLVVHHRLAVAARVERLRMLGLQRKCMALEAVAAWVLPVSPLVAGPVPEASFSSNTKRPT
jgi:hypothetical protein